MHLRPLHQHGPHEPFAGGGTHGHRGTHALGAAIAVLVLLLAVACGGGGDDEETTPREPADYMPDVSDLGYERLPTNGTVIAQPGAKILRNDYQVGDDATRKLTIYVYLYDELPVAQTTYGTLRNALKNPPPGSLGSQTAKQEDTTGPEMGDERHSYRVTEPDGSGNRIWSDIYRFGRVVYLIQVLDRDVDEQMELRTELVSRAAARVE